MNKTITEDQMDELLSDIDGEIYEGYSGRGMFGKKCIGVTGDEDITTLCYYCGVHGLPIPKSDSMGRGNIIYWPSIESLTN